jgi:hypothetical protein
LSLVHRFFLELFECLFSLLEIGRVDGFKPGGDVSDSGGIVLLKSFAKGSAGLSYLNGT